MKPLLVCLLLACLSGCKGSTPAPDPAPAIEAPPPAAQPGEARPPGVKPHYVECDPAHPERPCTPDAPPLVAPPAAPPTPPR